jgi:hypothetical protein
MPGCGHCASGRRARGGGRAYRRYRYPVFRSPDFFSFRFVFTALQGGCVKKKEEKTTRSALCLPPCRTKKTSCCDVPRIRDVINVTPDPSIRDDPDSSSGQPDRVCRGHAVEARAGTMAGDANFKDDPALCMH